MWLFLAIAYAWADDAPSAEGDPAGAPATDGPASTEVETGAGAGAAAGDGEPYREVHVNTIEVKVRARVTAADFPEAAYALPRDKLACTLMIFVDPTGTPTHTEPKSCDPALYPNADRIAMRYRFYPLKGPGGAPIAAKFELRTSFAPSTGGPTDIVTQTPEQLALLDARAGYTPVNASAVRVRAAAPEKLQVVPSGARAHPTADRVCRLRVRLGTNGKVAETSFVRCAADLREAAGKLIEATRFDPVYVFEERARVSFDAVVNYDGARPMITWLDPEPGDDPAR